MTRLPIRLRLALAFALVMGVVLAAMGAFVYVRFERSLTASLNGDLRAQIEEIQAAAAKGGDPSESLADPDTRVLSELVDARGRLLASGGLPLRAFVSSDDAGRVIAGDRISRDGDLPGLQGDWRLLAAPVAVGTSRVAVVVATSLRQRNDALGHLLVQLVIAGGAGIALTFAAGYGLATSALRPVEAMRRRAEKVSLATSDTRLPVPPSRDEIRRLGETLNAMLDRIGDALEHERRFVADASHELRTPLSLLKAELDLALARSRSKDELLVALRSASVETDRLVRLTQDLLTIARSDQHDLPLTREPLDVAEVAGRVVARFERRANQEARSLRVDVAPGTTIDADRLRLEQALANLIDNALEHGRGEVAVSVWRDDDWLELHVTDEGAGFDPGFRSRAFDRFSRNDESRSGGGSGLGLAIVDLVARAHGGVAGVTSGGRGADVWLRLPAQEDEPADVA